MPSCFRHFFGFPEGIVAVVTVDGNAATKSSSNTRTRYRAKDHLGSIVAEYGEGATDIQRYGYDVWGKRRQVTGEPFVGAFIMPGNLIQPSANRGFTGYEMLDEVGLEHMNWRIDDR